MLLAGDLDEGNVVPGKARLSGLPPPGFHNCPCLSCMFSWYSSLCRSGRLKGRLPYSYRLMFIKVSRISSVVVMTLEFAWYALCATMSLTNSVARSTFDSSRELELMVPRPPLPVRRCRRRPTRRWRNRGCSFLLEPVGIVEAGEGYLIKLYRLSVGIGAGDDTVGADRHALKGAGRIAVLCLIVCCRGYGVLSGCASVRSGAKDEVDALVLFGPV